MLTSFKKAYFLLTDDLKKKIKIILFLLIIAMLLEALSIGIIIPFLSYFFSNTESNTELSNFILKFGDIFSLDIITLLLILIFAVFLAKNLFLILNHYINSKFIESVKFQITNRRYRNYLKSDYKFFLDNNTSVLLRNITTEIGSLAEFISSSLILFGEISVFIGITTLLLIVDFRSTIIVALIASIFGFLIIYLTKKKLLIMGRDRIYVDGQLNKFFLQGLAAAKDVKLLKVEDSLIENTSNFLNKSVKINLFFRFLNGIIKYLFEILIITLFVFLVISLYKLNFEYNYILKTCALLGIASFRILPSVSRISSSIQQIRFREKTINDLYSEFKNQNKEKSIKYKKNENSDYLSSFEKITVSSLNFRYNLKSDLVLKNLSFEIKKGDFITICGESGSGKTTLLNLLIGLLKSEYIFCDGKNISLIKNWQNNIGYVAQDTYLIDDTIRRNIAFGLNDDLIDNNKIKSCLEKSQLLNFTNSLPQNLETIVGEKGISISGGQKQRIGVARALYHDPKILVFDEATSSLDVETETKLIDSIKKFKGDKTILFVTHRKSVINNCDKVLLLQSGEIKYFGKTKDFY